MGNPWTQREFVEPRLQRSSLIHINFEESEVWTVTKDAKITIPDMVGNIGGTLGVFIGFSFLGLLDTFIEWMQYLQEIIKSLKRPKSSLPLKNLARCHGPLMPILARSASIWRLSFASLSLCTLRCACSLLFRHCGVSCIRRLLRFFLKHGI